MHAQHHRRRHGARRSAKTLRMLHNAIAPRLLSAANPRMTQCGKLPSRRSLLLMGAGPRAPISNRRVRQTGRVMHTAVVRSKPFDTR
jgi:hypothetical protein